MMRAERHDDVITFHIDAGCWMRTPRTRGGVTKRRLQRTGNLTSQGVSAMCAPHFPAPRKPFWSCALEADQDEA